MLTYDRQNGLILDVRYDELTPQQRANYIIIRQLCADEYARGVADANRIRIDVPDDDSQLRVDIPECI